MAKIRKGTVWFTGIVMALAVFPASWAIADTFAAKSQVTINHNDGTGNLYGSVSSNRGRCVGNRDITLIKDRKHKGPKVAGHTTTDKYGNWTIYKKNPLGRYVARAERRLNTRYGHRHDCKKGKSPLIRIKRTGT